MYEIILVVYYSVIVHDTINFNTSLFIKRTRTFYGIYMAIYKYMFCLSV